MTNHHPDQSPTTSSRRWLAGGTPIWLVVSLVLTACFAVAAWFNAQWWFGFVFMMMMTVMLATELWGQRRGWNEAGFGVVLLIVIALSVQAITGREWHGAEAGLLGWGLTVVALGVRRIIRARRQNGR
jgi:hypothetical protein